MYRRIVALVLSVLLLAAALPSVSAESASEADDICRRIRRDYYRSLSATHKESLAGYCGLLASWQLYFMGVNKRPIIADGNKQFNVYEYMEETSGGYRVEAYSARDLSLEQALNTVTRSGTRDIYNVLVGFHWTDTPAGAAYGHTVVIYAILDGTVYFTEGFHSPRGRAGQALKLSIPQFVDFYDDWTRFEGLVVFENREYVDQCIRYPSDLFISVPGEEVLLTLPCSPTSQEVHPQTVRHLKPHERLRVSAVYENPEGDFYYQVQDSGDMGYIAAENAVLYRINSECRNFVSEACMYSGVDAGTSLLRAVNLMTADSTGKKQNVHCTLEERNAVAGTEIQEMLPEDSRRLLSVSAEVENYYIEDGVLHTALHTVPMLGHPSEPEAGIPYSRGEEQGWTYEEGSWYFFRDGVPCTGWICDQGLDYYLLEDGSAAVGWTEINGKMRFFSDTGVMRTGWMNTDQGRCYLMCNGVPAVGSRIIDGYAYQFDSQGILQTEAPGAIP